MACALAHHGERVTLRGHPSLDGNWRRLGR